MECFIEGAVADSRVQCSHHHEESRHWATKLLWTRVQNGVTKALAGTTLAELVEFSTPHPQPAAEARAKPPVVHAL